METVGLFGAMDTKGAEFAYVQERLQSSGIATLVIHCGTHPAQSITVDIDADEVATAAGADLETLRKNADRGEAVTVLARGAATVAERLFAAGRIQGALSLGGSAGTTIGTAAMRALPVGVPKVMVSTMASGDTRPYVASKDICMLYSVVDVAGLNRLSRRILANAAGAMSGMLAAELPPSAGDRLLVAATMFGVTTRCVNHAREQLEKAGYEVLVFHATGTGGRAMEDLVRGGFLAGVLDITTTELADELVGGVLSAGPERLEAAGTVGLPQVICPGALDMVNFGPRETVPEQFRERLFYQHNPTVTLMRTTTEENAQLGCWMAEKLNRALGSVAVLVPLHGVSDLDREGAAFHNPGADAAFRNALRSGLSPQVTYRELDLHLNDPEFAEAAASTLARMISAQRQIALGAT